MKKNTSTYRAETHQKEDEFQVNVCRVEAAFHSCEIRPLFGAFLYSTLAV